MPGSMLVSVSVFPTHPTSRSLLRKFTFMAARWSVGIWLRLLLDRDELPEVEHGPDLPYEQCPDRPGVVKFSLTLF